LDVGEAMKKRRAKCGYRLLSIEKRPANFDPAFLFVNVTTTRGGLVPSDVMRRLSKSFNAYYMLLTGVNPEPFLAIDAFESGYTYFYYRLKTLGQSLPVEDKCEWYMTVQRYRLPKRIR
jgi:hypothetical protein